MIKNSLYQRFFYVCSDQRYALAGVNYYFKPSFCFTWAVTSVESVVLM